MSKVEHTLEWTIPNSRVTFSMNDYFGEYVEELAWLKGVINDAGGDAVILEKTERVLP